MQFRNTMRRVKKGKGNLIHQNLEVRNPLEPQFVLNSINLNLSSSLLNSPNELENENFLPIINTKFNIIGRYESSADIPNKSSSLNNSICQHSKQKFKAKHRTSLKMVNLNVTSHSIYARSSQTPPQRLILEMNLPSKENTRRKINYDKENPSNEIIPGKIERKNVICPDLNEISKDITVNCGKQMENEEFKISRRARKSRFIAFQHFGNFNELTQKRENLFVGEPYRKTNSQVRAKIQDGINGNAQKNLENMNLFSRKGSVKYNEEYIKLSNFTKESINIKDLLTDINLTSEELYKPNTFAAGKF